VQLKLILPNAVLMPLLLSWPLQVVMLQFQLVQVMRQFQSLLEDFKRNSSKVLV
jgi:hypothetical protein